MAWPLGDMPHWAGCWRPAALVLLHAEVVVKLELLVNRRGVVKAAAALERPQAQQMAHTGHSARHEMGEQLQPSCK
jgi:hypothetical protein